MREAQARVISCPECGAEPNKPCLALSGKTKGKSRSTAHSARVQAMGIFISDAYCQNESASGYPCGRDGCPHCGGIESKYHSKELPS